MIRLGEPRNWDLMFCKLDDLQLLDGPGRASLVMQQ